jgi:hypothetical protein
MIVKKNRKGISTFIATLLLMVLAVAAGVVIYAYTMGYLGSFGGPQTMGAISLDTTSLNVDSQLGAVGVTSYIRNIGRTAFIVDSVYVNGMKIAPQNTTGSIKGYTFTPASGINEGSVGTLWIDQSPVIDGTQKTTKTIAVNFIGSTTYDIKIIGKDNTQLSFQVKK